MFKQGKGANIHGAVKIYAIANLLQGNIAIRMQHGGVLRGAFGRIFGRIFSHISLIYI
jgi:hypothetical protein